MTPARLTRPNVGISPTTPQSEAGPRIDPPVSEPSATGTMPAATAAPEPDEEPPVKRARFQGLRAGGHGRSNEGPACAISWVASLPRSTPPASYTRLVALASSAPSPSPYTPP